jgi:hypothetical protein
MVVDAAAGGIAGRARGFLVSVDHTDKKLAKGLVEDHLGDLPRSFKAKKALVELSAIHERKLPPETQLKTARSTKFDVDPVFLENAMAKIGGRRVYNNDSNSVGIYYQQIFGNDLGEIVKSMTICAGYNSFEQLSCATFKEDSFFNSHPIREVIATQLLKIAFEKNVAKKLNSEKFKKFTLRATEK